MNVDLTEEELERELQFLIDNPHFDERPATIGETRSRTAYALGPSRPFRRRGPRE